MMENIIKKAELSNSRQKDIFKAADILCRTMSVSKTDMAQLLNDLISAMDDNIVYGYDVQQVAILSEVERKMKCYQIDIKNENIKGK